MGLLAAIPAVVFYNRFVNEMRAKQSPKRLLR